MKFRLTSLFVALVATNAWGVTPRKIVNIHKADNTVLAISMEDVKSIDFMSAPEADAYESVDLGLTVEWATVNVDLSQPLCSAPSPESTGGYYGWGDPTGAHHEQPDSKGIAPYESDYNLCMSYYGGAEPPKVICGTEYDIARVKWGGDWRLPSRAEQDELRSKCTWKTEKLNGMTGYRVTGPNGNSIYLPAAGFRMGNSVFKGDWLGYYWSGTLNPNAGFSEYAYSLDFTDTYYEWFSDSRYYGQSVRPVRNAASVTIEKINGEKIVYRLEEVENITIDDLVLDEDYYETVDLGLSVRWAAVNLDIDAYDYAASSPEVAGGYYGWGDPTGTNHSEDENDYLAYHDEVCISGTEHDIIHAFWGGEWRLPTMEEMQELRSKCQWTWEQFKGKNGYRVTGPNGNSIFLPATGFRIGEKIEYVGTHGYYWTGTNVTAYYVYNLGFSEKYFYEYNYRYNGFQVRGVRK